MRILIIDFETTTPKGRPPEPIEVGVVVGDVDWHGGGVILKRFEEFINPPSYAPLTYLDTSQTGITSRDLDQARDAVGVLRDVDRLITGVDYIVAHNASVEAGVLSRYAEACPLLGVSDVLCSLRLARAVIPGLKSHSLDSLSHHFGIPIPQGRHRALADVELTFVVFERLLEGMNVLSEYSRTITMSNAVLKSKTTMNDQLELF